MNLLEVLKKFLNKNLSSSQPVLFAYSGGVDSSCLLDLILQCRKEISLDLRVVHINHGWRQESEKEARIIKEQITRLNISFHYKKFRIDNAKNLENESRNKRIEFFKFLYKKHNCQALILAHQKDDLAETVLKRILEGANLYSFTSMREMALFHGMTVWRPLLRASRKEILNYLNMNNIGYFQDKTNENVKYLRAKMRMDILPYLQKHFNKEIINNLAALSLNSLELNNYLERKTKPFLKNFNENCFGTCVNLNDMTDLLEIKYLVKHVAALKNLEISREILNLLSNWILEKKTNLRLKLKNADLYADRGYFFVLNPDFKVFNEKSQLTKGHLDFGPWKVTVRKIKKKENNGCWREVFQNQVNIYVPYGKYIMCYPVPNKKLKKIWENSKVPSFLRRKVPVICNGNKMIYEFLSGRNMKLNNGNILRITLKLK